MSRTISNLKNLFIQNITYILIYVWAMNLTVRKIILEKLEKWIVHYQNNENLFLRKD